MAESTTGANLADVDRRRVESMNRAAIVKTSGQMVLTTLAKSKTKSSQTKTGRFISFQPLPIARDTDRFHCRIK